MSNEAHIRSDDGVARDPSYKPARYPQPKLKRPKEGQEWTIPVNLNPDEIIAEYLAAGKTSGIAQKYGIRRSALVRWLRHVRPEQWKEAQAIRALCTKEDGQEAIYDSTTGLLLARARALVDAAQWDLERLDSSTFGQKQWVTPIPAVAVQINLHHSDAAAQPPSIAVQQSTKSENVSE